MASREVLQLHSDAAAAAVKAEMRKAAEEVREAEEEAAEEDEKERRKNEALRQRRAAEVFQRRFRRWRGQRFLRARSYVVWRKTFTGGANFGRFAYVDLRTGEETPQKPRLLGDFDLQGELSEERAGKCAPLAHRGHSCAD